MLQADIPITRGRVTAVLIANAILWGAVVLVTGDWRLGGPTVVALVSIGSLLAIRRRET